MTDLTPRQILDAIREALEETARRFAKDKSQQTSDLPQAKKSTSLPTEQDPPGQRH